MSSHQLIREGRKRLNLTEQQFADAAGVSRGAVQQWEKAGGTAPKRSIQRRVAALLGITVAELVSGTSAGARGINVRPEVPLVGSRGGRLHGDRQFRACAGSVAIKRHTYALRAHGDSMASDTGDSFSAGSILIVEPEMEARPGDYVIALNNANETTFKQLIMDGGDLYLKPLNARYPIKHLGSSKVIGVVREFTKRFR